MFGCFAYIHIPKDERKKLDPKAKKCTFLGYGTSRKGYRLYDWKTSSIIHSRDVVFNELSRGYEGAKEKRLVQVENFTEGEPEGLEPEEGSNEVESDDDSGEPEREEDPRELERDDREPEEEDSTDAPAPRRTEKPGDPTTMVVTSTQLLTYRRSHKQ